MKPHPLLACISTLLAAQQAGAEYRSIDGSGNTHDDLGTAGQPFFRIYAAHYGDGRSSLAGQSRANPRVISNAVAKQIGSRPNERRATDYLWQWGQFIDHDLTLSAPAEGEDLPIAVTDRADSLFPIIPFTRTAWEADPWGVRQQKNEITPFLDGSMVYGSDTERAHALRTFTGGKLKVAEGNMLPFNTSELHMDVVGPVPQEMLRLAGDPRANEQPGLLALHTIFVREHNRLCDEISAEYPQWTDEEIYLRARQLVGAMIQVITYREWLPALIGNYAPKVDRMSYDAWLDPRVSNEFATAFFRLGHTLVSSQLMRIGDDDFCDDVASAELRDIFFRPGTMDNSGEMELFLKGMAMQLCQEADTAVSEDLRSFLFGRPGSGGLDLAALNIQRGRDHGLASYTELRDFFYLPVPTRWSDVVSDPALRNALSQVYGTVQDVDLWVGALAEDRAPSSGLGELLSVAVGAEFRRMAMADRFFYRWDAALSPSDRQMLEGTRLSDIIQRNTGLQSLQDNVFFLPAVGGEMHVELKQGNADGTVSLEFMMEPGFTYGVARSNDLVIWSEPSESSDSGDAMFRTRQRMGTDALKGYFRVERE